MPAQTPTAKTETASLPSIDQLFRDSWVTFKQSALNLFVITILMYVTYIVILLVMGIIGFAVVGTSGLVGAFTQENTGAAAGAVLSMGLLFFLFLILFIILSIIITYTVAATMIMFIGHSAEKPQLVPTIKQGFHYILPLFGMSIVVGLLVIGGLGLFIIPGIVISILFIGARFEIVLNGMPVMNALRRSVFVIKTHFWEILVRLIVIWVLLVVMYIFFSLFSLSFSLAGIKVPVVGFIISFIRMILTILATWYSLAFMFTLYKQASADAPKNETASLKWIGVVSLIGWVFVVLFFVLIMSLFATVFKEGFMESLSKSSSTSSQYSNTSGSEITQIEADALGSEVFAAVNDYRSVKGLTPFEQDMKLCGYAQRRLQQLDELGKFDDYKGYYEDFANKDIHAAYFKDYLSVNEYVYAPVSSNTTPDQVVANWTAGSALEENKSIVASKSFNNACVRANPEFIVIEGGRK